MSEHSPGPWRWSESAFCPGWLVDANGDLVLSPMEPADVDVSEADAQLIASAPTLKAQNDEMKAMLREMETAMMGTTRHCTVCDSFTEPASHAPDCRLAKLLETLR